MIHIPCTHWVMYTIHESRICSPDCAGQGCSFRGKLAPSPTRLRNSRSSRSGLLFAWRCLREDVMSFSWSVWTTGSGWNSRLMAGNSQFAELRQWTQMQSPWRSRAIPSKLWKTSRRFRKSFPIGRTSCYGSSTPQAMSHSLKRCEIVCSADFRFCCSTE